MSNARYDVLSIPGYVFFFFFLKNLPMEPDMDHLCGSAHEVLKKDHLHKKWWLQKYPRSVRYWMD